MYQPFEIKIGLDSDVKINAESTAFNEEPIEENRRRTHTLSELQYKIAQQKMGTNGQLETSETSASLLPPDPVLLAEGSSDESTTNIGTATKAIQAAPRQRRLKKKKRVRSSAYNSVCDSDSDSADCQPQEHKLVRKKKTKKVNRSSEPSNLPDTLKKSS